MVFIWRYRKLKYMILATHGIVGSSIVQSAAAAFFARVTAAGGSLTTTEQSAINTLVNDLINYGIWTKTKALYPMVGASAAACAQNLMSSSFTGSFTSGWTFASTGVTPNGTSAYFNTNISPNNHLVQSNTHLSFYSRTANDKALYPTAMGSSGSSNQVVELYLRRGASLTSGTAIGVYSTSKIELSDANALGFSVSSRTSTTSLKMYRKNTLFGTNTTLDSNPIPSNNIYIGAASTATSFQNPSILQCAFASIGDGLTDTEASNFYTAVQAFQTTLSRQV